MAVNKWQPSDEDASVRSERFHIRVRGINKTFGPHHVLRAHRSRRRARQKSTSSSADRARTKSVIMKHLMGLLKPDTGHIYCDGEDLVPLDEFQLNRLRKKFGMLFRYAALFDSLTVEENIVFPLVEHGDPDSDGYGRTASRKTPLLAGLNSTKSPSPSSTNSRCRQVLLRKFPSELSGGQRKSVGLARALVMKPQILLYDEPTTGLDPVSTKNVDDMIRDVSHEHGVTSVIISHDMASTFRMEIESRRCTGVIIDSGAPRRNPQKPPQVAA